MAKTISTYYADDNFIEYLAIALKTAEYFDWNHSKYGKLGPSLLEAEKLLALCANNQEIFNQCLELIQSSSSHAPQQILITPNNFRPEGWQEHTIFARQLFAKLYRDGFKDGYLRDNFKERFAFIKNNRPDLEALYNGEAQIPRIITSSDTREEKSKAQFFQKPRTSVSHEFHQLDNATLLKYLSMSYKSYAYYQWNGAKVSANLKTAHSWETLIETCAKNEALLIRCLRLVQNILNTSKPMENFDPNFPPPEDDYAQAIHAKELFQHLYRSGLKDNYRNLNALLKSQFSKISLKHPELDMIYKDNNDTNPRNSIAEKASDNLVYFYNFSSLANLFFTQYPKDSLHNKLLTGIIFCILLLISNATQNIIPDIPNSKPSNLF